VTTHALLNGEEVGNLIIVGEDTPDGWVGEYVTAHPDYTDSTEVPDGVPVSLGYLYRGGEFLAPYEIEASAATLRATGAVAITYTDNRASAPDTVTATIGDQQKEVSLVKGKATFNVTANGRAAGDTLAIELPGASLTLEIE
jgi:hypothetical protein